MPKTSLFVASIPSRSRTRSTWKLSAVWGQLPRPWAEGDGGLRDANPFAGTQVVDRREIAASDFDRSGWRPGQIVEPLFIPVPELTPGRHRISVEILDIRPQDESGRGYWVVSGTVVADEPWPGEMP